MANPERSAAPLRRLSASDLGVGPEPAIRAHSSSQPDDPALPDDDPRYLEVRGLLDRFGGVIFSGPPGTSKTWYAAKIGSKLVDEDEARIRFVQFHPSYQYEDFMQGFVPRATDGGFEGFELVDKHFVAMCREAESQPDKTFVLVIDELSRGDPGRVFGEALTYVEKSKRRLPFRLASGDELTVPPNLVILATMNPLDRGVDEVDAAFERRFARIAMKPDRDMLETRLELNGVEDAMRRRITGFFNKINGWARNNPQAAVGHTYFWDVRDETTLQSLWNHQLRFLVEKAYRLDPEAREELESSWERIFEPAPDESPAAQPDGDESGDEGEGPGGAGV